jgi:hypothetical protein
MIALFWSRTVTVSGVVPPLETETTGGETVIVVTTGATTETVAVAVFPSLVAVIVTGPPVATPVTRPAPDTVAMPLLEDVQVTTRFVNVLPAASRRVAENWKTAPGVTLALDGARLTVATGGGTTVTVADPSWPSLDAMMVTGPPTATALTSPAPDTVATAWLVDDQVIGRPVSTRCCASSVVAVNWVV